MEFAGNECTLSDAILLSLSQVYAHHPAGRQITSLLTSSRRTLQVVRRNLILRASPPAPLQTTTTLAANMHLPIFFFYRESPSRGKALGRIARSGPFSHRGSRLAAP